VRAGYEWLYKQSSLEVDKYFETAMDSERETRRARALYYFSGNRSREDLQKMLEAQLCKETYYYNIVTWLDRLLYSPEPLREFFIRELQRLAN
jgi:hypothetical protein